MGVLPVPVPKRVHKVGSVLLSLLMALGAGGLGAGGGRPAAAAEQLELRLEGLQIPLNLNELERWSVNGQLPAGERGADLAVWLGLLDADSRRHLRALLRAPLLRDRSFGRQLLDTWTGNQLLAELGGLLTSADGRSTTPLLQPTLRQLLAQGKPVTAITLLRALPEPSLSLQLDDLLKLAQQWRLQLNRQQLALQQLQQLPLPRHQARSFMGLGASGTTTGKPPGRSKVPPALRPPRTLPLRVAHRPDPLPLEIWPVGPKAAAGPWVLITPGLGGTADQLRWLAAALAERGWPVVVVQHPGSDALALRASFGGERPPPGIETLGDRLADLRAVLTAQRRGELGLEGKGVVVVGHSLGGLTALLLAGLQTEPGLERRCRQALRPLPIANPSQLLQCQLLNVGAPPAEPPLADLRGIVLFNSFGSLLWPQRGLAALPVPLLMVGGSLDLITPPLAEQWQLFRSVHDRRSRLVLVDGGSHFSPVQMSMQEEALFQLGDALVGVDPTAVQGMLLRLTVEFMQGLNPPLLLLPAQRRLQQGVTAYVLDPPSVRRWRHLGER